MVIRVQKARRDITHESGAWPGFLYSIGDSNA